MNKPPTLYTRRRWLQTMGLWTLGAGVSAKAFSTLTDKQRAHLQNELASWGNSLDDVKNDAVASLENPPRPSSNSQPQRPPEPSLRERHPEYFAGDYAHFLDNFSYRHIRTHEVIAPHIRTRNGVDNGLPPSSLWENIPKTLKVADEIRDRLGTPLSYITSAYRTPEYNEQCGGASRSFHTRNYALDLVYEAGSEAAFEVALQLRKEGFFSGGIGFYSGFIHIDTRGYDATWNA